MRKTKFEKVKEALKNKTRASNCWVTLTIRNMLSKNGAAE
jgi:hypothetical protein